MQVVVHQEQQPQQPSPQGFNARVNGALRKPGKLASQSLGSINESYKQKKQLASQSVTNLNDGLQRRQKMASRSVSNLQDRGNQYMAHTVALCDLISSKLDQIITSIDDEVFSGNEQELGRLYYYFFCFFLISMQLTNHVADVFGSHIRAPSGAASKLPGCVKGQ